jgi:hypothetical protein
MADPLPEPNGAAAPDYDAFVIYADADADWCIRELVKPLEDAKMRVVHKRAFKLGLPQFKTEDDSIRKSACTIAFLTPEWVRSNQTTFLADRAGREFKLIPVLARQCDPDPRIVERTGVDLTDPSPDRWREGFQRLLEHLGRSAQEAQQAATQTVVRGLQALAYLMRHKPVCQDAVSRYELSFERAAADIELIGRFKKLHDGFQEAEGSFKLVLAQRRAAAALVPASGPPDTALGDELADATLDFLADLRQLRDRAGLMKLPAHEVTWLGPLKKVITDLEAAVEVVDAAQLGPPLLKFQRMLGSDPPELNRKIVHGVANLALVQVADSLQDVRSALADYQFDAQAQTRFEDFGQTVASLRVLARNLEALQANHNWLQRIDGEFTQLDGNRRPTAAEVKGLWDDVTGPVSQLDAAAGPSWVNSIRDRFQEVDEARAKATDPAGLRALHQVFNTFRVELSKSFNKADVDLLDLCEQLRTVGQALRDAIKRMQNA